MTTYYVGKGGNDGNSGLSWASRKLTLNGAEDIPVVAGDVVYVGPGAYRELLILDVDGGIGNEIAYIADVTGENTDQVGGIVRITGSLNDQSASNTHCITGNGRDYRTFRGFFIDTATTTGIRLIGDPTNILIEDCSFQGAFSTAAINIEGNAQSDVTIRRCYFPLGENRHIRMQGVAVNDANHTIENCTFIGCSRGSIPTIDIRDVGGVEIRNITLVASNIGVGMQTLTGGAAVSCTINNSIITGCNNALSASVLGDLVENYNTLFANTTDRTNVAVGANSQSYPPLFLPNILFSGQSQVSGFRFPPPVTGELSEWSQIAQITGTSEPTEDLLGIERPATASKNSWGAVQFQDVERESTTVYAGTGSLKIADAGIRQKWKIVDGTEDTVSVRVYREANYAGTNPQLVIKQPGQSDIVVTDVGAALNWNLLTSTFTPSQYPPFVVIELVSNNTAVAGNYAVYFDSLE